MVGIICPEDSNGFQIIKVTTTKTESEKVTNMVGTFLNKDVISRLFRRGISYNYQQIVLKFVKLSTVQATSEKVTNTVGTFLNEFIFGNNESVFIRRISYNYQQIVSEFVKVSAIKEVSEKVTSTVGTFLNEVCDGLRIIGVNFHLKRFI